MASRKVEDIANIDWQDKPAEEADEASDHWVDAPKKAPPSKEASKALPPEPVEKVSVHYPEPTPISVVLQAVAKWSDLNFVMDPALNRTLQIFAPRKMAKEDALQTFIASLETIGLRALHLQGSVIKIVPMHSGRIGA